MWLADLELAAEIGKNLLERNKELEVMLKSSHQYLEEQSVKNEVGKGLTALYLRQNWGLSVKSPETIRVSFGCHDRPVVHSNTGSREIACVIMHVFLLTS